MGNELYEFKTKLLNTGLFRHRSGNEYSCICPFCGKNHHCYVLFDLTNDTPLLYNCFRCNAKGIVNQEFLEYFNLDDIPIPKTKTIKKIKINETVSVNQKVDVFNKEDTYAIQRASDYIQFRVGVVPTATELEQFQVATNPKMYAQTYLGVNKPDYYYDKRIWFKLTNCNIHGRNLDHDDQNDRWLKFKTDVKLPTGWYSIKKGFDIESGINVIISEGIFDSIGLYYYYKENHPSMNNIYVSVLGKNYEAGLYYVLNKGIFGKSVSVKIFKDPNVDCIRVSGALKQLFKDVLIYENAYGLDYGHPADKIEPRRILI